MRNICLALVLLNMLPGLQSKSKVLTSGIQPVSPGNSKWGEWDMCPDGSFAAVFQLIVEADQDNGDDTALNGIILGCAMTSAPMTIIKYIESEKGLAGRPRNAFPCDAGFITGFQLRNDKYVYPHDTFGVSNVKIICSNLGKNNPIEGDGIPAGEYSKPVMCKKFQAVCGQRTLVDRVQGPDITSLNDVEMMCCDVPNPIENCTSSDGYEELVSCDNLAGKLNSGGDYYLNCTYAQSIGVSIMSGSSSNAFDESGLFTSMEGSTGFGFDGLFTAKVIANLEASSTTGTKWTTESSRTFSKKTTSMAFFTVPPGLKVVLQQVVATCGFLQARSTQFRKMDFKKPNPMPKPMPNPNPKPMPKPKPKPRPKPKQEQITTNYITKHI